MTVDPSRRGLRPLDRLSWQDAGYLRRESDAQPMHFVLQMMIDASESGHPVTLQQVREHLAGRLHRVPALRRKVRAAPLGRGPMVWVDDGDFALDRHVRHWEINDGLAAALGGLTARRLDVHRPLWELAVAAPLPDGRTPMALSIHHALMDGGLVVGVLEDLFGPGDAGIPPRWQPASGPSRARLLAVRVRERLRDRLRAASRVGTPPTSAPAPEALPGMPTQARLAGAVGGDRSVAFLTLPLEDLRCVRQATGATINDVYLAAVADALREYLAGRGDMALEEPLLALVPRDVRAADEARAAGNRTWSLYVPLPVAAQEPLERLARVRAATAMAKAAERSFGAAGFRFDIAISNVRLGQGHRVAGAAVRGFRATAPLQGENRLLAVGLSYEEDFTVTFTADAAVYSDLNRLAVETGRALGRLRSACAERRP